MYVTAQLFQTSFINYDNLSYQRLPLLRSQDMILQLGLFCRCGSTPAVAGLCRRCYCAQWRSQARFGGNRHRTVARDGSACRVCLARVGVVVHHRAPGKNATALLVTLCRACHAALHHRTAAFGFGGPSSSHCSGRSNTPDEGNWSARVRPGLAYVSVPILESPP